jgi:hypothetical protein
MYICPHGIDPLHKCGSCDTYPPPPDSKPTNPKDLIGSDKLPLGLCPATAAAYQTLGHLEGHLKYGLVNWREAGVRTMIYVDAALRHLGKFTNGEWEDPETRVPHLGSVMACMAIIIDAYECGKLVDDRPRPAPAAEVIDRLSANVKHLKKMFKDRNPIHYTIEGPVQMPPVRYQAGPVCMDCKGKLGSPYFGAGDGTGQRFRCAPCHRLSELNAASPTL